MATASNNKTDKVERTDRKGVPGIKVICAQPGFRRGGYAFGPEPVEIPLADLNKDQLQAIRNEPKLAVVDVTIEPSQADQAGDTQET